MLFSVCRRDDRLPPTALAYRIALLRRHMGMDVIIPLCVLWVALLAFPGGPGDGSHQSGKPPPLVPRGLTRMVLIHIQNVFPSPTVRRLARY